MTCPRHGVELELRLEPLDGHRLDGEEVEEQGAVRAGGERDELALVPFGGLHVFVDLDEVGGFAAERRTVVNDLHLQLFGRLIYDGHNAISIGCSIQRQFERASLTEASRRACRAQRDKGSRI